MIKKLLLSLCIYCIAFGSSSNWYGEYLVSKNGNTTKVSHTPEMVCFDFLCARTLSLSGQINDMDFRKTPLRLDVEMSRDEFEAVLKDAGLTITKQRINYKIN